MGAMAQSNDSTAKVKAQLRGNIKLKASDRKKLSKDTLKRYDKLTAILVKLNANESRHCV